QAPARPHKCRPSADGAVAQLGERVVRNDEVRGSIPLSSTSGNSQTRGNNRRQEKRRLFRKLAWSRGESRQYETPIKRQLADIGDFAAPESRHHRQRIGYGRSIHVVQ